jgi:hypothetical protein
MKLEPLPEGVERVPGYMFLRRILQWKACTAKVLLVIGLQIFSHVRKVRSLRYLPGEFTEILLASCGKRLR